MGEFLSKRSTSVWIVHHLRMTCCELPHLRCHFPPFSPASLHRPHHPFSRSSCCSKKPETRLISVITCYKLRNVKHLLSSAYRLFWTTEDTSRATMPAPTAPMTTPNTMSHGGVAGWNGAARVGTMPMNSRVLSVSRKALLMRFLDFLMGK